MSVILWGTKVAKDMQIVQPSSYEDVHHTQGTDWDAVAEDSGNENFAAHQLKILINLHFKVIMLPCLRLSFIFSLCPATISPNRC